MFAVSKCLTFPVFPKYLCTYESFGYISFVEREQLKLHLRLLQILTEPWSFLASFFSAS